MIASPPEACRQPHVHLWWGPSVTPPWRLPLYFVPRGVPGQPTALSQSNPVIVRPLCHLRHRDGGSPHRGHHKHPEEGGVWDEGLWVPWLEVEELTGHSPLKVLGASPSRWVSGPGSEPRPPLLWMMRLQQRGNPALGFPRGIAQEV